MTEPNAYDLDTLTRTAWGEARGETDEGIAAVCWTVKNRSTIALHDNNPKPYWWGETVAEVCLKSYQYSCWLPSDPNRVKMMALSASNPEYLRCWAIARCVLSGLILDPTGGATHYVSGSSMPAWAKERTPCVTIGHHVFFNDVET